MFGEYSGAHFDMAPRFAPFAHQAHSSLGFLLPLPFRGTVAPNALLREVVDAIRAPMSIFLFRELLRISKRPLAVLLVVRLTEVVEAFFRAAVFIADLYCQRRCLAISTAPITHGTAKQNTATATAVATRPFAILSVMEEPADRNSQRTTLF